MKSYSSREVIAILLKDGWREVDCEGDHHQFKHPIKKDIPPGTLRNIERQAGVKFK